MSAPKRIQLRRTKGWRKPEGAIVVARPRAFSNWYSVRQTSRATWGVGHHKQETIADGMTRRAANQLAVDWFRQDCLIVLARVPEWLSPIAGRDLACWCPLDQPCHADVLLELANGND